MVCAQVIGNDTTIAIADSQGNFFNVLHSLNLLADSCRAFQEFCVEGLEANRERIDYYVQNSLMLVTALNQHIGYDNAAKIAKKAYQENISLQEAAEKLGLLTAEQFAKYVKPEEMIAPEA